MKIYLYQDKYQEKLDKPFIEKVVVALKRNGAEVLSNQDDRAKESFSQRYEEMQVKGIVLLNKIDGVLMVSREFNREVSYLMAFAVSQKKPVWQLVKPGAPLDNSFKSFVNDRDIGKYYKIVNCYQDHYEEQIANFLKSIDQSLEVSEVPKIKFTLRITPRIERYLSYKVHNTKLSKADYLRELVEKDMKGDVEFQKFIKTDK